MLVMYGDNHTLILAIVDTDLEKIKGGETLEYINPPHGAQLVRDIIVCHAPDKAAMLKLLEEAKVNVSEPMREAYLKGERTDRGWGKPS